MIQLSESAIAILHAFDDHNAHTFEELAKCLPDINVVDATVRVLLSEGCLSVNRLDRDFYHMVFNRSDYLAITDLGSFRLELSDANSADQTRNKWIATATLVFTIISAVAACTAALLSWLSMQSP